MGSMSGGAKNVHSKSAPRRMKWKIEHEKSVVCEIFERRDGWVRTEGDDWNIYWASVNTVQTIFNPEKGKRLTDDQLICHFPNHYELTRKDLMIKNIKRHVKEQQRQQKLSAQSSSLLPQQRQKMETFSGESSKSSNDGRRQRIKPNGTDIIPTSYLLPADFSLFVEEFRRSPNSLWIMKPANGAQGRGIFIVNKLDQIKKWSGGKTGGNKENQTAVTYVVSRYVERPLLIGGKKFDLRLYVLVTSFRPLRMYLGDGFARFCTSKYSSDVGEMNNMKIHLTNVSVQKRNENYNPTHGGKWRIKNLRLYLESTRGLDATKDLFEAIDELLVSSAKSVQNVMISDRHCFECYGYDLLIDENLKPWLLEVNASPSLSATTKADKQLKSKLIHDILEIVVPESFEDFKGANSTGPCRDTGDFVVLYDEAEQQERLQPEEKAKKQLAKGRKTSWR